MPTSFEGGWSAPDLGLPKLDRATVAGIAVAISGNILISFALNCQKLAHRRLELEREHASEHATNGTKSIHSTALPTPELDEEDEEDEEELTPTEQRPYGAPRLPEEGTETPPAVTLLETQPLLDSTEREARYGSSASPNWRARLSPWQKRAGKLAREADRAHLGSAHSLVPVDVVTVHANGHSSPNSSSETQGNESDYLKSKLWWLGFALMNVGEMGNFISYAFAPASIVAPLGTFALVANCFFAPLMLKERFRKRDVLGILIAIIGAVTVVLSANPSDTRLSPEGLVRAITQRPFIAYSIIYAVLAAILSSLSAGSIGQRYVFVDVGLCAIFGGFTVLSTKAFSTLLTREWFEIFAEWITYPVIAVLLATGIGQIRYLNRALMRFDSKIVVPTQFVMFNLSAIIGSAILYGDFKRASFHQIVTFLYGCAATFAGVFVIAWTPSGSQEHGHRDNVHPDADVEAATVNGEDNEAVHDLHMGSLGRRSRATLVIPDNAVSSVQNTPILRNRRSVVSLIGLSPAQRVLLVHGSPREDFMQAPAEFRDEALSSGSPHGRRRTMSLVGEGASARRGNRRIRSNIASRDASQSRSMRGANQSPP